MIVDKFDPNPILVNINKLKPYQFQDSNASRGLKSIVKMGRDLANIEIRVNITILENVQGTCTKFSISMDGTENKDSIVGTKIQDTLVIRTKNGEDLSGTKILIIGFKTKNELPTKNSCSKTKIWNLEWAIRIHDLMNISLILDPKYPIADSSTVQLVINVVNGKSMDESKSHFFTSKIAIWWECEHERE